MLSENADSKDLNLLLENFCFRLVTPIAGHIIRCMRESPSDPRLQAV